MVFVTVSVAWQYAGCPWVPQKVPMKLVVTSGEMDWEPLAATLPMGMMMPPEELVEVQESVAD